MNGDIGVSLVHYGYNGVTMDVIGGHRYIKVSRDHERKLEDIIG